MPEVPSAKVTFGLIILGLVALGSSCSAPVAPLTGRSSFEILPPPPEPNLRAPGRGQAQIGSSDLRIIGIPARPRRQNALPIYPPAALAARSGEHVVYVTLTVDENGRVTNIRPNWRRVALPGRFTEEFINAATTVVAGWEFTPARLIYWRKVAGKDDEYVGTENVPESMELKFTFEASGAVR